MFFLDESEDEEEKGKRLRREAFSAFVDKFLKGPSPSLVAQIETELEIEINDKDVTSSLVADPSSSCLHPLMRDEPCEAENKENNDQGSR